MHGNSCAYVNASVYVHVNIFDRHFGTARGTTQTPHKKSLELLLFRNATKLCSQPSTSVLSLSYQFKDGYTWKYWTCLQNMTMMNMNTKMMSSGHMALEVSCSVRAALSAMPGSRYTAQYPYVCVRMAVSVVCVREKVCVWNTHALV